MPKKMNHKKITVEGKIASRIMKTPSTNKISQLEIVNQSGKNRCLYLES